ncbi:hypothetical protein KVT40_001034 [Elsinoe batatas]|uniref:ADF-H domain-containing protein n=1 Tax=Elsinoe batatas TaxID=2601811 RepID=A0A8K0L8V6_9PEZI|nr:hypothetical protein KVT40_001034 [Elsinoe batatas]
MSLNGLDSPDVIQAFTTAISEPAGWFLLKYVSRDTVEILGTGASGVFEARTCMTNYEEKSPLYGVIMFRRKRVLIKYIPEGTSRLLQVRTAVHFKDVIEKYSPYDALLDITTVEGLSDTNLAATFPLHAGAASVSANQLDEITEDAEELSSPASRPSSVSPAPSKMSRKAALDRMTAYKRSIMIVPKLPSAVANTEPENKEPLPEAHVDASEMTVLETDTPSEQPQSPIMIVDPVTDQADEQAEQASIATTEPTLETSQLEQTDSVSSAPPRQRPFSPNPYDPIREDPDARPDSAVLKDVEIFDFRPKVKLGPRPVQISDRKKVGQMPSMARRATATLPARVQIRKQSVDTLISSDMSAPSANAMDDAMLERPTSSSSSQPKSQPALASTMDAPDEALPILPAGPSRPQSAASFRSGKALRPKTPLTPEKQRLLKAVEMRRRHLRQSQRVSSSGSTATFASDIPTGDTPTPSVIGEQDVASPAAISEARASLSAQSARKSDSGVEMTKDAPQTTPADQDTVTEEDGERPESTVVPEEPQQAETGEDEHEIEAAPAEEPSQQDLPREHKEDSPGVDPILGAESSPSDPGVPSSPVLPSNALPLQTTDAITDLPPPAVPAEEAVEAESAGQDASETKGVDLKPAASGASDDESMPPANQQQTSTFFSEADSTRDVSLAPTDELGKTALYEDSISTKGTQQDQEAFFDTASEKSNRNTWLSDASELQDRPVSSESVHVDEDAQRRKRRGIIASLAIPTEQSQGERTTSADGSEFEYFTTATVHEAKSMAVLRSPATPVVAKKASVFSMGSSSTPTQRPKTPPDTRVPLERVKTSTSIPTMLTRALNTEEVIPTIRRAKTTHSSPVDTSGPSEQKDLITPSRKGQLGSGISQRIAKLEQKSREGSPLPSPKALPTPPLSNGGLFNKNFFSNRPSSTASTNPDMLKDRLRSIGMLSGHREAPKPINTPKETNAYYTVHTDPDTRRQSVSVTAKIVRPNARTYNEAPANLETPAITLESDSENPALDPPSWPPAPRERSIASTNRQSADSSKFKRFSFHRAKSHESRLDSLASTYTSSIAPPRPPSPLKTDAPSPAPSSKRDRTSRFLKRMSGLSAVTRSSKRRSDLPPTTPSQPQTPAPKSPALSTDKPFPPEPTFSLHGFEPSLSPNSMLASPTSPLPPIRIGDVNVQFPHSGLWKRRFVEIDTQGNLVFSVNDKSSYSTRHGHSGGNLPMSLYNAGGGGGAGERSGSKAWHLREFERVFVPRADDMELAYSVVLEMVGEEGEVVVACEDGRGQREVLNALLRYHQAWNARAAG